MGILIYIIFALLAAGIVVLCIFMLKKEIQNYKQEKEQKLKEEQEKQLESDVKDAISNRV